MADKEPVAVAIEDDAKEEDVAKDELGWFLSVLNLATHSIGIDECILLLESEERSKLPLSSGLSELAKGIVIRGGCSVLGVDASIKSKWYSGKVSINRAVILAQLSNALQLFQSAALVLVEIEVARKKSNAGEVYAKLEKAEEVLDQIWINLKGDKGAQTKYVRVPNNDEILVYLWVEKPVLHVEFVIIKPIEDSLFRRTGNAPVMTVDGVEVSVLEKIEVRTTDPGLISLLAKLRVLRENMSRIRYNLGLVMKRVEEIS
ncbi:hypothetical protein CANCADRAFT_4528 [Tortispora caseinolytica NRRL Y-17796]|uniref:RAVE subunit 2/Rogdi n=1 Tax=Tortispora caseinolytica NRRL Y-17796 TaxID=767744 RepID=A0A1E4T9K6_9ASCO|nr:hypothetical protein CANCADRAFT_4528 [Tortispora caseinolytica NRRL Y-17796]